MKKYAFCVPHLVLPIVCTGYNEADARKRFRDKQGFGKRLPNGTKVSLIPWVSE